jgi:hypothetical protein
MASSLNTTVLYCGILTQENVSTAVNYNSIFLTPASGLSTSPPSPANVRLGMKVAVGDKHASLPWHELSV